MSRAVWCVNKEAHKVQEIHLYFLINSHCVAQLSMNITPTL